VSEDLGSKLSRWSQRKLAARRGAENKGDAGEPSALEGTGAPKPVKDAAAGEETPVLPPIDELTAESDYTVFLGKNVPETITRAALRKLWLSDPVLANLDRLNDYDEDYSIVDTVVSAMRTSYQVGKGYVDEVDETVAKLEPSDGSKDDIRAESSADSSVVGGEASGGTLGNSDTPGDESAAASRQQGAADLGGVQGGQVEDKDN
jgi:hypothetical protein